jgi:protein O-mannosyl-transferase
MSQTLTQPKPSAESGMERPTDTRRAIVVCGFLGLAVLLVFGRTMSQGFSSYDDSAYVYDEPHVTGGLSWSGVAWAFTNGPLGEWYPLSMLSHMLDCQLYGLNPAGHHLTNVLLHAAATVVLFLVLWRMTAGPHHDTLWPSALVAALFALHPLHVESVAWLAERRDVLSGLFFMLTLGAYCEYARHPESLWRYLAMLGFFALGLMAKPMLVTLPPLLLLLDFWPLGRFRPAPLETIASRVTTAPFPWRVLVDKLPLLALALFTAGVTMLTHSSPPANPLTIPERMANAAVACVAYLGQLFVPVGLSIFYSHPESARPAWQVAGAVMLLVAITAAALIHRRAYPYFFVGWFWYIGMLIPVLGLSSVGTHARADRYTYLSQIGLYIALVWGAMRLGAAWPARRWVFGIGSALLLVALVACTWRQTGYWQDDLTLWQHALACDEKNVTAHRMIGTALSETDENAAAAQFRQALQLGPDERNIYCMIRAQAHCGLGNFALRKGDARAAIAQFEQALESYDKLALAHVSLADVLIAQGNFEDALVHLKRSVDLEPNNALIRCKLAVAQAQHGKPDDAIASFKQALKINPSSIVVRADLATLLAGRGDLDQAMVHLRQAIEIDRDAPFVYDRTAQLLRVQGKTREADKYEKQGKLASARYARTQNQLGTELARQGKLDEAIARFQVTLDAAPEFAQAHCNLADALAAQGRNDDALAHYRRALEIDPNLAPAQRGLQQLSDH